MRINIPLKLKQYKKIIKESSYKVIDTTNFKIIKIASTLKNETYKELYICYNPYNIKIKLDINDFSKNKNIYKLYPGEVVIPSKEISSFMVFSNKELELELDLNNIMYNQKDRIKNKLNKIKTKNKEEKVNTIVEEYNANLSSTLVFDDKTIQEAKKEIEKINLDKTKNLTNVKYMIEDSSLSTEYENYYAKPDKEVIKFQLEDIKYNKKKYNFLVKCINSDKKNYVFEGIKITLSSPDFKKLIKINKKIKIKNNTSKSVKFSIEESFIKDFLKEDININMEVL